MLLFYLVVFLLSFFLLVIVIFYIFIIVGYFRTSVPFVSSPRKKQNRIFELMNLKEGETLIDLGCGNANFLISAEKKYKVKTIGYEFRWLLLLFQKSIFFFKNRRLKSFLRIFSLLISLKLM